MEDHVGLVPAALLATRVRAASDTASYISYATGGGVAGGGRAQIFEEVIAVAPGRRTKRELSGVGEDEFAPWIITPVM